MDADLLNMLFVVGSKRTVMACQVQDSGRLYWFNSVMHQSETLKLCFFTMRKGTKV